MIGTIKRYFIRRRRRHINRYITSLMGRAIRMRVVDAHGNIYWPVIGYTGQFEVYMPILDANQAYKNLVAELRSTAHV